MKGRTLRLQKLETKSNIYYECVADNGIDSL
jgi:hypothetical protein